MGKRILKLRERLEWSQSRMAKELGVSQPTVWRIENGIQQPSKSVLKLIDLLEAKVGSVTL